MRRVINDLRKSKDYEYVGKPDNVSKVGLCSIERMVCEEQTVEGDRVVTKRVLKEVDPRDNFKDYKVSDFFIENLQASGAIADLKTVQFIDQDVDGILDALDSASQVIENQEVK